MAAGGGLGLEGSRLVYRLLMQELVVETTFQAFQRRELETQPCSHCQTSCRAFCTGPTAPPRAPLL